MKAIESSRYALVRVAHDGEVKRLLHMPLSGQWLDSAGRAYTPAEFTILTEGTKAQVDSYAALGEDPDPEDVDTARTADAELLEAMARESATLHQTIEDLKAKLAEKDEQLAKVQPKRWTTGPALDKSQLVLYDGVATRNFFTGPRDAILTLQAVLNDYEDLWNDAGRALAKELNP